MTVKAYRTFKRPARQIPDLFCADAGCGPVNAAWSEWVLPDICFAGWTCADWRYLGGTIVRAIAAILIACALGGCAGGNVGTLSGEWKVEQRADRVADKPVRSAVLITRSRNAIVSKQDPIAPQIASLQLLCFDGEPVVRLYFSSDVGSDRNSRMTYKTDNNPARKPNARILQDFQTVMIENKKDVAQLAADLRGARRLDVTVMALINGMTTAEFNVDGAPAAIDTAFESCPLTAQPAARAGGPDSKVTQGAGAR